jgi:SAM-dependent methyltransferase
MTSQTPRRIDSPIELGDPSLELTLIHNYADYLKYRESARDRAAQRAQLERELIEPAPTFYLDAHCHTCATRSRFRVDYCYSPDAEGSALPNWRERLTCQSCGMNNRLRAVTHLFPYLCTPMPTDKIYLTEQTTRLYRWLSQRYVNLIGSEYLGNTVPFGTTDDRGIRNESLTRLSFPARHFRHILTFDVLEHIPDYAAALRECWRCLAPGGSLLISVPYLLGASATRVRARVLPNGDIEHLLPPEYHGDPLTSAGCLCYYHFGWDLLTTLAEVGFSSTAVALYWSREYAYLGGDQMLIIARK